jgi:hypothetical protein
VTTAVNRTSRSFGRYKKNRPLRAVIPATGPKVGHVNNSTPAACGPVEQALLTNSEFKRLLRRAAAVTGRNRFREYELLKRQLSFICGWHCRNPAYGPEHYQAGIRMLCRVMEV